MMGVAVVLRLVAALLAMAPLLASLLAVPVAHAQALIVEAPPALRAAAAQVRATDWDALDLDLRRAGLDLPAAIHVTLVSEDVARARGVPAWVVGRAYGTSRLEIFPARAVRYPYASLDAVLRHEVVHLALAAAADDRWLPRWFHEGVATSVEGGWSGADHLRLALAALTTPGLDDLHTLFASQGQAESALAYLLAARVVDDVRARQGADVPGAIARRVATGVPFRQAFVEMTGETPDEAAARAWSAFRWYTPLLASSASGAALWTAMLGLAAVAFVVRRVHRARRRAQWDAEEAALEADATAARQAVGHPPDPLPPPGSP